MPGRNVGAVRRVAAAFGLVTAAALVAQLPMTSAIGASHPTTSTGLRCTIVGTKHADHIRGTNGNDVICGLGGNDVIDGRGGNDVIDGGSGNDTISGGSGNDTLIGGSGTDKLDGGTGHNTCIASGADTTRSCGKPQPQPQPKPPAADVTKPIVVSWTASAGTVDTSTGAKTETLTAHVTDNASGVKTVGFELDGPAGAGYAQPGAKTSGTALDGVWSATITLPLGAAAGSYGIGITAADVAGNSTHVNSSTPVTVTNNGDVTKPAPLSWQIASVIHIDGSQTDTVTARLTDDYSGVKTVAFELDGPAGAVYSGTATRTSGTDLDGTWQAVVNVPANAPAGAYHLAITPADNAGNGTRVDTSTNVQVG